MGPQKVRHGWVNAQKEETDRQTSYDIAYTWNLKNGTNKLIYKTEIESKM